MNEVRLPLANIDDESSGAKCAPEFGGVPQDSAATVVPFSLGALSQEELSRGRQESISAQLRFGTGELTRDQLPLPVGRVVSLREPVQAPIQIVLHGQVLAEGELVSHEGRFGIRIVTIDDAVRENVLRMEDSHAA